MKGRKPKPAGIRALHHSRTRPHHQDVPTDPPADQRPNDGEPDPSVVNPPAGLAKAERVFWRRFAPLLATAQVLTPADVETLADYCRCCAAVEERARLLRVAFAAGELDRGLVGLLDRQLRGWVDRKTRLASELGLTAVSRTRVAWSGHSQLSERQAAAGEPKSKLAQLQAQAAALRRPIRM
jgi:phage terminase small subunit